MDAQAIFNAVATHLFRQGKPAYSFDEHACMYRTPDGLKCAVGCLIPDELYTPLMEFQAAGNLITYASVRGYQLPEFIEANARLLRELQEVHDDPDNCHDADRSKGFNTERLIARLTRVATKHKLDTSVLDAFILGEPA